MANPKGELKVKAGGKEYRLHLGMSVLADLQEEWGDKLDAILSPAENGKLPNLRVMHAIFLASLTRHHPEADRYTVDDIIAENQNVFADLLGAAFPDPEKGKVPEGNGKAAA